jgi:hypothetical protein
MMKPKASGRGGDTDRVHFQVLVDAQGDGHPRVVKPWALCGPGDDAEPVMTVMLEEED